LGEDSIRTRSFNVVRPISFTMLRRTLLILSSVMMPSFINMPDSYCYADLQNIHCRDALILWNVNELPEHTHCVQCPCY
jgi:hypothetical protein